MGPCFTIVFSKPGFWWEPKRWVWISDLFIYTLKVKFVHRMMTSTVGSRWTHSILPKSGLRSPMISAALCTCSAGSKCQHVRIKQHTPKYFLTCLTLTFNSEKPAGHEIWRSWFDFSVVCKFILLVWLDLGKLILPAAFT